MFSEGANIGKIWAWLKGGGIFDKTRRFIICNNDVHFKEKCCISRTQEGAICQLVIRTVSVVEVLSSNKGCSDKLMRYTNKGEKGRSVLLPKPTIDLVRSLHVGIRGTCAK